MALLITIKWLKRDLWLIFREYGVAKKYHNFVILGGLDKLLYYAQIPPFGTV